MSDQRRERPCVVCKGARVSDCDDGRGGLAFETCYGCGGTGNQVVEDRRANRRWFVEEATSALDALLDTYPEIEKFGFSYERGRHRVSIDIASIETPTQRQGIENTGESK